MKGKKRVIIQNNRGHYEFVIKRNITIIQGDSASGKTTLVNMIRQAENLGESSGINVSCEVPCRVLEGVNWKIILENSRESIFFIDEENYFIKTEEFASAIRGSENYFVLITRENLYNCRRDLWIACFRKIQRYQKNISENVSDLSQNSTASC